MTCSVPIIAQDLSDSENRQLEAYLKRLSLDQIVAMHLEHQLETTKDAGYRQRLAENLASVYAAQLLDFESLDPALDKTQENAQRLFAIYPDLDSPLLRVAILHAQYQKTNLEFHNWWYAAQAPQSRQKLTDDLRELNQALLQLKRRVEERRSLLTVSAQFGDKSNAPGMDELENVLLHTQYLIGWSSYFRALVERENELEWLEISETHFRDFLQIESNKLLTEVSDSWFDFDSGWTARGLIGLALCKQAQNQPDASKTCFDLLSKANRKSLDRIIPLWQLKSLLFAEQIQQAFALAQTFEKDPSASPESRIQFWTMACRGGLVLNSPESDDAKRLIQLAMIGLTREWQASVIQELIQEFNIQLPTDNFLGNWINGYLLFVKAESTNDRATLLTAQKILETALQVASAETNELDKARCRFLLASIQFRNREFEAVEQNLKQVVTQLRNEDSSIAALAHWYRIQSLIELSRKSPRTTNAAFTALEQMVRWFPDAEMTQRVEFEKTKLNLRSLPDDEAVQRLLTIPSGDPSYAEARYELIQRQYRVWLHAHQLKRPDQTQFDRLAEWEREYRNLPQSTTERRLRTILLVVDAQRRRSSAKGEPVAGTLLDQAAELADALPDQSSPIYLEFQYHKFLQAQAQEPRAAEATANWLLQHARDTSYEQTALVFLAQQFETRQANGQSTPTELQPAITVYRRLLEVSGDAEEDITTSQNSRIALSRLAVLSAESKDYSTADELNQRLLNVFPNNPDYLLAAARVKMKLEQFDSARALWRKLTGGVEAGGDVWHEAKYGLASCIGRTDPDAALQLIRQTRQLSPEMPPEWIRLFDSLASSLKRQ